MVKGGDPTTDNYVVTGGSFDPPIGLDEEQNAVVDGFGCLKARTEGGGFEGVVCFSAKDHGADAADDIAPTLRAGGHDGSHANAGVMPAVAFQERGREGGRNIEMQEDLAYSLTAPSGGGRRQEMNVAVPILEAGARTGKSTDDKRCSDGIGENGDPMYTLQGGHQHAVAFAENQRGELRTADVAPQLSCAGGKPGSGYSAAQVGMAVRRLTPVECERLQDFQDNFTLVDFRGKPAADGNRYKALGNAVTTSVIFWLANRIAEVEAEALIRT